MKDIFTGGKGTIAGIHWAVWLALPVVSAAGGAITSGPGRRGYSALGAAGGSLIALTAFAILEMQPSGPRPDPEDLKSLLR